VILRRIAHAVLRQDWTAIGIELLIVGQITRQLQVYYAQFDEMMGVQTMLRQIRTEGVTLGYPLGLSAFAEMDADQLIGIVRGSTTYSTYLRTAREWSAIHLTRTDQQRDRAQRLVADIDAYLGHSQKATQVAAPH
jgi:hypothetical protein